MNLLEINSLPDKDKQCTIQITEKQFNIQGDFYYLVNKEFHKSKSKNDICALNEYMGLGSLRKRSPKKTLVYLVLAVVLEFVNEIVGKIQDIFFFGNTDWLSCIVNVLVVICIIMGMIAFFSKKKVIEITFLSKRICVDEKMFAEDDINKMHQLMMKLR